MTDYRDQEILRLNETIASQNKLILRLEEQLEKLRAQSGWRGLEIALMRRKLCNAVHKVARRGTR
jgi:hypothetical protein